MLCCFGSAADNPRHGRGGLSWRRSGDHGAREGEGGGASWRAEKRPDGTGRAGAISVTSTGTAVTRAAAIDAAVTASTS